MSLLIQNMEIMLLQNIYIKYNMPTKINMFISNGNPTPKFNPLSNINYANL